MRIIHFVTGGFSGSTNVAKEIIKATNKDPQIQSLMVLRKKKSTTAEKVQQFQNEGIDTFVVTNSLHFLTIYQLYKICKIFKPDILVVHGFSEHLWGRYAGLLAKVPHLIHVEHNSHERYNWWRLAQAKWLTKHTSAIVGCSEGVKQSLLGRGFPSTKIQVICNGIHLERFAFTKQLDFFERKPEILMAARFSGQKDQTSLIKAIQLLKVRGVTVKLRFAGLGNKHRLSKAKTLVKTLQLEDQIEFLGHCHNLPELLGQIQLFVLSTHYEGMPLALIEAMAAGCAVIGSEVVGVQEMINHGVDGYLVKPQSPESLANAIETLITHPDDAKQLAQHAQTKAYEKFSVEDMASHYQHLFKTLLDKN